MMSRKVGAILPRPFCFLLYRKCKTVLSLTADRIHADTDRKYPHTATICGELVNKPETPDYDEKIGGLNAMLDDIINEITLNEN